MTPPTPDPTAWQQALDALPREPIVDDDCCFGHEAALPYLTTQLASTGVTTPAAGLLASSGLPGIGSGS